MSEFAVNAATAILQRQSMQKKQWFWRRDARRSLGYLVTGFMLSALAARAEAPPSQEFWNYLLEYGDAQGEVFDPADYASVANLPEKARAEFNRTQMNSTSAEMPASTLGETPAASPNAKSAQEQSQ